MASEVMAILDFVERSPAKIIPGAIRNTNTKIVNRLLHGEDQAAAACALGLQQQDIRALTALQPGEAVALVEGQALPVKVKVPDIPLDWKVSVTDEEVREAMRAHYLEQPLPRPLPPITLQGPEPKQEQGLQATPEDNHDPLVRKFLSSPKFMKWAKAFAEKDQTLLIRYIAKTTALVVRDDREATEVAARIYIHLSGEEQMEHRVLALIRREIEVVRNGGEPRRGRQPA